MALSHARPIPQAFCLGMTSAGEARDIPPGAFIFTKVVNAFDITGFRLVPLYTCEVPSLASLREIRGATAAKTLVPAVECLSELDRQQGLAAIICGEDASGAANTTTATVETLEE